MPATDPNAAPRTGVGSPQVQNPAEGLIFHSAGPIDGGWGVIDVWESRDAFDAFLGGRLRQAVGELGDRGFPGPPDIKEFPVHHYTKP